MNSVYPTVGGETDKMTFCLFCNLLYRDKSLYFLSFNVAFIPTMKKIENGLLLKRAML